MDRNNVIAQGIADAMSKFARAHSATLILVGPSNGVDVGSAVCIMIGNRFLLATAGHNLDRLQDANSVKVFPPSGSLDESLSVQGWNTNPERGPCARDVGWIELDPNEAIAAGLSPLPAETITPCEAFNQKDLYVASGLPAAKATPRNPQPNILEIGLTFIAYLTIPVAANDCESVDFVFSYEDTALDDGGRVNMPPPHGMSGGGVWSMGVDQPGIWSPTRCKYLGIIRSFHESSHRLYAVRLQHWLDLVAKDFPDLSTFVQKFYAGEGG